MLAGADNFINFTEFPISNKKSKDLKRSFYLRFVCCFFFLVSFYLKMMSVHCLFLYGTGRIEKSFEDFCFSFL